MHVERAAQVDRDQRLPVLGLHVDEVLEAVPAGVVDQHIDADVAQRAVRGLVVGDVEHERTSLDLARDRLRAYPGLVGDQQLRAFLREAPADGAADGAAAAGHQDGLAGEPLHLGRLSITRFALPIERSMLLSGTLFTSALMPMYDLIACCSPSPPSPSTSTVRWSSGPCFESSRT